VTEIQHVEDLEPIPQQQVVPTTGSIQKLEAEAHAMDVAWKLANSLSKTAMVPEHFQQAGRDKNGKPHGEVAAWNLCAAILYGAEIGLSAVQSAQNVFIVRGKPAVYSRTMAAQVRRAGYVIEEVEASNEKVVWKAYRDGTWSISEWSIERAQAAGYTTNKLYQTNPMEMLRAKCIAEVCRIKFQDVLLGMAYSVEELNLVEGGTTVQRVVKKPGGKGLDKLRQIAEAQPEPDSAEPSPEVETVMSSVKLAQQVAAQDAATAEPDPQTASAAQLTEIRKLYNKQGIKAQGLLDEISMFMGRKVTSLNELTSEEADDVISAQAE